MYIIPAHAGITVFWLKLDKKVYIVYIIDLIYFSSYDV